MIMSFKSDQIYIIKSRCVLCRFDVYPKACMLHETYNNHVHKIDTLHLEWKRESINLDQEIAHKSSDKYCT